MVLEYLEQEETGLTADTLVMAMPKAVVMAVYALAITILLRNPKKWVSSKVNRLSAESYGWLYIVNYDFWGYVLTYITYFVLATKIDFQVEYDYMISFAMSLFIFGIGYLALLKPVYLEEAHNGWFKYESSSLSPRQADEHLEKLLAYMEEEKPYLNGDLKMDDPANSLSIPSHHLSQIINERTGKNFFEFVNLYRVEEAKNLLADPEKKDFKILRVAFESGFNNKTTFNSAFKNEVGITPSHFRKNQLENY